MRASVVNGKANMEARERAARELLGIPHGGKVPKWSFCGVEYTLEEAVEIFGELPIPGLVRFKEIHADIAENGLLGASEKTRSTFDHCVACVLDDDPDDTRTKFGTPMSELEHPTQKGRYRFPDCGKLRRALENPTAREHCSPQALEALDEHAANLEDIGPDWF